MIRYFIVLYLGLVSVLLIDPNPFYSLPLLLVLFAFLFENRWVGLLGILGYSIFTLGNLSDLDLTNFFSVAAHFVLIMLPLVVLLELVLASRPYRIEGISIGPILVSMLMTAGLFSVLFALSRFQRIGVYLNSDPVLQVFMVMALSIFFFGPPLLGGGSPADRNSQSQVQKAYSNTNE